MSILAAILIATILIIRLFAVNKLPRRTFLVLWGLVIFRLLIPLSIPLPFSTHTFLTVADEMLGFTNATITLPTNLPYTSPALNISDIDSTYVRASGGAPEYATRNSSLLVGIWVVGIIVLAMFFVITHFRCHKEYLGALPIKNDFITKWRCEQNLWRSIQFQYTDRINTPMTYGMWKPIILFPINTDWQDETQLRYVLTHEITHIRRFDVLFKWLLVASLCVHWFNPLVWVMYILANRDIEFACDEAVVWTFGEETKSAYAKTLIGLEKRRSGFSFLCTNFASNAIEERIKAIMKLKKTSVLGVMTAILMVFAMTIGTIATFAQTPYLSDEIPTAALPVTFIETYVNVNVGNENIEVLFNIPASLYGTISEQELIELAHENLTHDANRKLVSMTIYEAGYVQPEMDEEIGAVPLLWTTTTTVSRRPGTSERTNSNLNFFITSVARGQTLRLTSAFSQTQSVSITVGTGKDSPFSMSAGLSDSITATRSTQHDFAGPPEGGLANSREFRVRFYYEEINWTQVRDYWIGGTTTRTGTGTRPTRYFFFSTDWFVW
jgi:beta-lactamase regulating signal transducer with metallopeptidase domain